MNTSRIKEYLLIPLPENLDTVKIGGEYYNFISFQGVWTRIKDSYAVAFKNLFWFVMDECGGANVKTYETIHDILKNGAKKEIKKDIKEIKKFCKDHHSEIINLFEHYFSENYSWEENEDEAMEELETYLEYDRRDAGIENIFEEVDPKIVTWCYLILTEFSPMFVNKKFDPELFFDFCMYFDRESIDKDMNDELFLWTYLFCIEICCYMFTDIYLHGEITV